MRSSSDNADESIREKLLDTSEKRMLPRFPPPHGGLNFKSALKIALVLFLTIFYLAFCVVVRYRNIPIGGSGVLLPFASFSTQSGITTIAILIVYVALWPINGLIDEIRSEEFFRLLRAYPNGVPLDSVNAVSTPTTGPFDIFLATIRRRCSLFLTSTLGITLVITAISSLAPAALNTRSILIDVDDPTFLVGAIPINQPVRSDLFSRASTISWVENILNLTNAYHTVVSSDDELGYIVPFPPGYTAVMQAYWTTDIIVLDPLCSWQTPNATFVTPADRWLVTLAPANLSVPLSNDSWANTNRSWFTTKASVSEDYYYTGSTVFVISQVEGSSVFANLSTVPTVRLTNGNIFAFLLCSARASIQTRRVRTAGNGILALGQPQKSLGNLDLRLINVFLSWILNSFETSSGPSKFPGVGTDMMIKLLFAPGVSLPHAPLTNPTAVYQQIIQSAMKTLLSGAIATANVPGGLMKEQVVFTSSLGHVITSTILFAILAMALVAAQFRTGRDAFTLVDVAAVLADSDAPQKCVQMKQWVGARERKVLRLVPSGDGGLVCIYESFESSTGDVDETRRGEGK